MTTARLFLFFSLSVASVTLGCRAPAPDATNDASVLGSSDTRAKATDKVSSPRPVDVEQLLIHIEAELNAAVQFAGSQAMGYKDGERKTVVVFLIEGENYCRAFTPEAEWESCEFLPGVEGIQWSVQQYLGLAVVSYTDAMGPRLDALRCAWTGVPGGERPPMFRRAGEDIRLA